jgi:hypothetical protein
MRLLDLAAAATMGSIFLFPAVAVFLRRHPTMLWVTTGIGFCLILWFAAFAASVPKNASSAEYGYSLPLQRSLLTHSLRLGLPQIAATVAVQALAGLQVRSASPRRLSSWLWLYIIGVLSAMAASLLGGRLYILVAS